MGGPGGGGDRGGGGGEAFDAGCIAHASGQVDSTML